eukprot:494567_1
MEPVLEIEYISLNHVQYIFSSFSWLNKWLKYFPMYLSQTDNFKSRIITTVIFLLILFHSAMGILWIYLSHHKLIWSHLYGYMGQSFLLFGRTAALYFCYKRLNFSWLEPINEINLNNQSLDSNIINANRLIKYSYFVSNALATLLVIAWIIDDSNRQLYHLVAGDILGLLFVYLPMHTLFALSSLIFLKYKSYLSLHFSQQLNNKSNIIDFAKLLHEYKLLIKSYNNEYYFTALNWSIIIYIIAIIMYLWIDTHELHNIIDTNSIHAFWLIFDCLDDLSLLWLFYIGAFEMTETFRQFEKKLYEYGSKLANNNGCNGNIQYINYNYLLQYCAKYPLNVQWGNVTFTKLNATKFVITFIILKLFAYSFRSI